MTDYKKTRSQDIEILYTTSNKNEEYQLVAQEFIKKIFTEFAKGCMNFYRPEKNLYMMPYYYSERRFDSVILPVLSKLCDGIVLTELPVQRLDKETKETKSEHGRMDYWCIYKGYTFIIEMKRTNDNLNGTRVRKNSMIDRWKSMHEQINDPRTYIKEELIENTKGVIPIGLHFVTCKNHNEYSFNEDYYKECHRDKIDYIERFRIDLSNPQKGKYKPDYCGLWMIPKDLSLSSKDFPKKHFICPYLMLFCMIGRKITHAGATE